MYSEMCMGTRKYMYMWVDGPGPEAGSEQDDEMDDEKGA